MKRILEKLNLYKSIIIKSDLSREELSLRFKKLIVLNDNYLSDELTKSDRKYIGIINEDKFKIRVKRKFMNFNIQYSNAIGKFHSKNNKTEIEIFGIYYFIGIGLFIIFPLFYFYFFFYQIIKNEAYPAFIIFILFFIFIIWNPRKQIRNNFELFSKNSIMDINNL